MLIGVYLLYQHRDTAQKVGEAEKLSIVDSAITPSQNWLGSENEKTGVLQISLTSPSTNVVAYGAVETK